GWSGWEDGAGWLGRRWFGGGGGGRVRVGGGGLGSRARLDRRPPQAHARRRYRGGPAGRAPARLRRLGCVHAPARALAGGLVRGLRSGPAGPRQERTAERRDQP